MYLQDSLTPLCEASNTTKDGQNSFEKNEPPYHGDELKDNHLMPKYLALTALLVLRLYIGGHIDYQTGCSSCVPDVLACSMT